MPLNRSNNNARDLHTVKIKSKKGGLLTALRKRFSNNLILYKAQCF